MSLSCQFVKLCLKHRQSSALERPRTRKTKFLWLQNLWTKDLLIVFKMGCYSSQTKDQFWLMYWSTSLTGMNLLQVQSGHSVQPTPVQICWLTTHSNLKSKKTGWNRSKVPLSRDSSGRQEKVPFVKNKSRTLSLNWFTENLRRNQCLEVEVRSSQQPDALLTTQFCWLLLAFWSQFS